MTQAAVPRYLGSKFKGASPSLQFNMFLEAWEHSWNKAKGDSGGLTIGPAHLASMRALHDRQEAMHSVLPVEMALLIKAESIAPFATGLGNEHPQENGFSFLNPYGLPYLSGSSVKGVVRRAAEELTDGKWGGTFGWTTEPRYARSRSMIDLLFGPDSQSLDTVHARGALSFWDVIPQVAEGPLPSEIQLAFEIMTPHQTHYYQGEESPHDSGDPKPVFFLAIQSGSKFTFCVTCDLERLRYVAADLVRDGLWKTLLSSAFQHAFDWVGFGAKTAAGYGAMRIDPSVEAEEARRAKQEAERRAREEEDRKRLEAEQAEADRKATAQAEFDALPESRKLLIGAERAFRAFKQGSKFDNRLGNEADGYAKRLSDTAPNWIDKSNREEAATLLESYYDATGWHRRGANKTQRTKQERKKRDAVARIRNGV